MSQFSRSLMPFNPLAPNEKKQQNNQPYPFIWSEVPITAPKDVAIARQLTAIAADQISLSNARKQDAILITSELAQNHLVHKTQNGIIRIIGMIINRIPVINIASLDEGPGIPDIEKAMEDGFSTSGGLGIGLGTIKRLSSRFDICSMQFGFAPCPRPPLYKKYATIISSIVKEYPDDTSNKNGSMDIAAIVRPCPGQDQTGDVVYVQDDGVLCRIVLLDATGHGDTAAQIAERALNTLEDIPLIQEPHQVMDALNTALLGSNGASVQVLIINYHSNTITATGIGNVSCTIYTEANGLTVVPSWPGLIGSTHTGLGQKLSKAIRLSGIKKNLFVVMHTDGILHPPNLSDYLADQTAAAIWSHILFQPQNEPMDDASLVVIRWT